MFIGLISYSQKKFIYVDSLFQNKDKNLVISKAIAFEGKTKNDLKNKFKEAANKKFIKLKEITESETDDNMTLIFIEEIPCYFNSPIGKTSSIKQEYTKLIASFKDNEIKIDLYDDGNVYIAASMGSNLSPATPGRIIYIKRRLKNGKLEIPTEKDLHKMKNFDYQIVNNYITKTKKTIPYFEIEMNK